MNKNKSTGVGFTGLLQVAFIVLKLCGIINWSWWWVLCPSLLMTGFLLIGLIASIIIAFHEE
jgi:hypothetical protein